MSVLKKLGQNAYEVELQDGFAISIFFYVADLYNHHDGLEAVRTLKMVRATT